MSKIIVAIACLTALLHVPPSPAQAATSFDIVVYGGSAGGAIAAVAVAREGKSVLLIEPGKHLGGMVSGGLGATDFGNKSSIGGYSREFFIRVREYYKKKFGADSVEVKDCADGYRFEPHVATRVFHDMLDEARVVVIRGWQITKANVKNRRIESIELEISWLAKSGIAGKFDEKAFDTTIGKPERLSRRELRGSVFIDASYEGDLMALAKVRYATGREGADQYQESIAGVQKHSPAHQWPVKVSPFDAKGKLLPFVQSAPAGSPRAGDNKTQAYNFRLCMTQRKDRIAPFPKPANYDAKRYELLARYLEKRPDVKVGQLMNPVKMPTGVTDTNNNGPFSTDHIGANWDYPDADYKTRERIWRDHIDHVQGFLFFLANDRRVPPALHKEMNSWGLAKDEFTDCNNWPHQLYVREARRMLGEYVMTQTDIMDKRTKEDSVGLGSYNTDSHHVQRVVSPDGFVINEGDFQVRVSPYAISYRSLIPKAADCENLFVPVCCSASHVAYGTIRMEPVYMILGQASGVAAAVAIDDNAPVQKVSIEKLQAKLKAQKAVLSPEGLGAVSKAGRGIDPKKMAGIVVDDTQATKTGHWVHSASAPPYVGDGYLHDNNQEQGRASVRFVPKVPQAGKYEVRLFYSPHANRATNALVVIRSSDGEKTVRVDQRKGGTEQGFVLGVFGFAAGQEGYVEIRNEAADGFVIADAVQLIAVKD